MAWETRGNRRYYYRKVRRGSKVTSTYAGSGRAAALMAEYEAIEQQRRDIERAEWQATCDELAQRDQQIGEASRLIQALVSAAIVLNGYYRHKRQWRKRGE